MATFKTFEDIEAWQQSRKLTKSIYEITSQGAFARDLGLHDQIRKASVSILSNIAEGLNEVARESSLNSWQLQKVQRVRSERSYTLP